MIHSNFAAVQQIFPGGCSIGKRTTQNRREREGEGEGEGGGRGEEEGGGALGRGMVGGSVLFFYQGPLAWAKPLLLY